MARRTRVEQTAGLECAGSKGVLPPQKHLLKVCRIDIVEEMVMFK